MQTNDADLTHYGVKGMRWGVVNKKSASPLNDKNGASLAPESKKLTSEETAQAERRARVKKVAIGVGILTVAAGTAYVAYSLNKNGGLPLNKINPSTASKGVEAVKKVTQEPTSVFHSGRGKNVGFRFIKTGGLPDPMTEHTNVFGMNSDNIGMFKRYGDRSEKVAASFYDPEGRKDWTGRPIFHEVIVPSTMSSNLNNVDDVVKNIWPMLKSDYDKVYNESKPSL